MITAPSPHPSRPTQSLTAALWAELVLGPPAPIQRGWHHHAACADDPRFLARDEAADRDGQREVCTDCPVIADCLREALQTEDSRYVIATEMRGGLTARQRNRLRHVRRRTHHRPPAPSRQPAMSKTTFMMAVTQAVDDGATYTDTLHALGYTGRRGQFYRRLWRARRLDLYRRLRAGTGT